MPSCFFDIRLNCWKYSKPRQLLYDSLYGKVAKEFEKFGFATRKGNSSTFVNTQIELCHKMFYGTHGHIAIRCNDLERAVFYLAKKGFSIIKGSEKYDAKGKLKVCYLDPEVGGFAIHLVK